MSLSPIKVEKKTLAYPKKTTIRSSMKCGDLFGDLLLAHTVGNRGFVRDGSFLPSFLLGIFFHKAMKFQDPVINQQG